MKVLILGANGMLGHKLYQVLSRDFDVYGTVRQQFSVDNKILPNCTVQAWPNMWLHRVLEPRRKDKKAQIPDVIVNCIGIVAKEYCENNRIETYWVNQIFPFELQKICQKHIIRLIHTSTDCVFSGKDGNYVEGSPADATDVYGKTKYLGEVIGDNVLTIRTSLIGRELVRSRGLLEWFISQRGKTVNGFSKAIFSGFPTITFAGIIKDIILNHPKLNGIYHIASEPISKYQLLKLINEALELGIDIIKMPAYHCDRSLDATKFNKATGFVARPWVVMLDKLAEDCKQYEAWR